MKKKGKKLKMVIHLMALICLPSSFGVICLSFQEEVHCLDNSKIVTVAAECNDFSYYKSPYSCCFDDRPTKFQKNPTYGSEGDFVRNISR